MNRCATKFMKEIRLPGSTRYLDKDTSKQGGQGATTNIIYEQNTWKLAHKTVQEIKTNKKCIKGE